MKDDCRGSLVFDRDRNGWCRSRSTVDNSNDNEQPEDDQSTRSSDSDEDIWGDCWSHLNLVGVAGPRSEARFSTSNTDRTKPSKIKW